MDPALWELLRGAEPVENRLVEAIIRLRRPGMEVPGVRIVSRFGRIATCRLDIDSIREVRGHADVLSLKAGRQLGPEYETFATNDRELTLPQAQRTVSRRRPEVSLTGKGVVVGVVDWGMDFDHPNFKTGKGTRLLALWDQRATTSRRGPEPFGYGRVHNKYQINRALRSGRPYQQLGYHPAVADRGGGAHGTHVMDIAAGNGRAGGSSGVAPEADLVFVHLADRDTGGLANLGDSVRLLEAVDFVARTAGERPWVINLSVGRHGGPHDGTTVTELAFDEILTAAPGRFIVQSTGNYFRSRTHACGLLTRGQVKKLTFVTDAADTSSNELELWYDGDDEFVVRIDPPGAAGSRSVRLGRRAELIVGERVVGRIYHRARDPNNGDNHVDAFLYPWARAGTWTVTIEAKRVRSGRFHAWLERDEACTPCQARFTSGDSNPTCTTGTIANGHMPLVAGAYDAHSRSRPVAAFSSSGPTRDDRRKPDLAAPGVNVLAARSAGRGSRRSRGQLVHKSGSSMASPHVCGAVALCLQAGGHRFDAHQIRALVLGTTDLPTSKDPMHRLGHGYLDIPELVAAVHAALVVHPLRQETKEDTMDADLDVTLPLASAPARSFRELMYHPDGRLSGVIGQRYDVLARPGQWVRSAPQAGDVMLQVDLGRPGVGSCVVLLDSKLTRQRTNDKSAMAGWYVAATDAAATASPVRRRILDASRCVPSGQLILRPRPADIREDAATEHEFGEDDAENRTPVPVDAAAAVPPFDPNERVKVLGPLLSGSESSKALAWNRRVHPATSGVTLDEIGAALASYVDAAAVQAAMRSSEATAAAVLVECVHQFQMKCYLDKRAHDGLSGESTLDSLGLVARSGSALRAADRGNANAQRRLIERDPELKTVTADEFSAANWFDRMADPSVFGQRTKLGHGLHVVLVRKLRQAERHLLTLPTFRGLTPVALGAALGLSEKHGGARPTQTGSTSVHTFGLAIDIAYTANPWVRRATSWDALRRAAKLVSGTDLNQRSAPEYFSSLGTDPARSTGQVWDEVAQRNAEFIAYFALDNDDAALRTALLAGQKRGTAGLVGPGESVDGAVARWRTRIRQDRQALAAGDFDNHEPPGKGFLSHARDLVIALRDHGCLAWGAVDLGPGALGSGDIMHFDARIDGAGRVLTKNTRAHLPTVGHPCLATTSSRDGEEHDDAEFSQPRHVLRARTAWATLFPNVEALAKVRIYDLSKAPAKAIADSDFSAWTNSPTRIYVAKKDGADDAYWMAVLYHESLHIGQFNAPDGGPPASYATMMRYECDAYTESGRWAGAHKNAAIRTHAKEMRSAAAKLSAEIAAAEKDTPKAQRDQRYQNFLLREKLLPPHKRLEDLYTPAGSLRNPAAVESTDPEDMPDEDSASNKAKNTIRSQATRWGTDEAAILSALRALLPSEMAELSADPTIVDTLRDELSGSELVAAGAELARGRVGSMARVDINRIVAAPALNSFGTLAAAIARDVLLGHQEAFDRTGTGTIHGSQCGAPTPAGATASDCTEYVKDVLDRTFAAKSQVGVWTDVLREASTRSGIPGLKGTEVMRSLQAKQGWEALFWAPDPQEPADGLTEHPYAYTIVRKKGTYYRIVVDQSKSVINYRRTDAASRTDLSGIERLRRLQFGVLAARGGTHMALVVNGEVYEVHRSSAATARNAIEATPLENFAWQSGAIAASPGDLALAWRTP